MLYLFVFFTVPDAKPLHTFAGIAPSSGGSERPVGQNAKAAVEAIAISTAMAMSAA
jgi:hypothetical protein